MVFIRRNLRSLAKKHLIVWNFHSKILNLKKIYVTLLCVISKLTVTYRKKQLCYLPRFSIESTLYFRTRLIYITADSSVDFIFYTRLRVNITPDSGSIYPEKSFFYSKKFYLNQTNLCILSKKSFFDLNKFLDCFFFFEFRKLTGIFSLI